MNPNAVADFKERLGLTGSPIVGVVARLDSGAGLDLLLRAIPRLVAAFPALQLLVVGDGPNKPDLIRLAYELKMEEHVVISHPLSDLWIPRAAMEVCVAPPFQDIKQVEKEILSLLKTRA